MPVKTPKALAEEMVTMGWDNIKKDQTMLNTCSKALAKRFRKETFNYLNDKNREPNYLYVKYIKGNDVNVSSTLQTAAKTLAEGPKKDTAKLGQAIKKIDDEVKLLFKTNLKDALLLSDAFKHFVHVHNMPEYKKLADASAAKLGKVLGIKSVKELSAAFVLRFCGEKAKSASMIVEIEKKEKAKDLAKALEASLKSIGMA